MIKFFLQTAGWLTARAPEVVLRALCSVLARLMLWLLPRRRRLVFSNLDHAFPDRSRAWKRHIALESSRRLFETGLISLAAPYLGEKRIRSIISIAPELDACFAAHHASPFPLIISTPHLAYWESLTWLGLFLSQPLPEFGVIFRPLNNPAADLWVKATRERFGMKLLSRKTGLQEAFKYLKRNSVVGLLFDQNAGMQGALTTLCGRICSTSELTDLLAQKYAARIQVLYPRRRGFWRLHFETVQIEAQGLPGGATVALNRWLESTLGSDDGLCASWLWSHDRWRNQDVPERRFRLEARRNLLAEEMTARGWTTLPRKTRIWIRLPNWLGDVVMALPLLRALRQSRPDAELTFIAKAPFLPLLELTGLADRLEALPARGRGYFRHFLRLRLRHPDTFVLFTHSFRGDFEAWLTRTRQRFGVVWPGKRRPLLTHRFEIPADFDEARHHQFEVWQDFFSRFGLNVPPGREPLQLAASAAAILTPRQIGFIAGSENTPEKRWPVPHWRTLLAELANEFPGTRLVLLGTKNDQAITRQITEGLGAEVVDLAGQTDLAGYIAELQRCHLLVSNDTGGMHLANALGVPLIALFGPTNPVRTGPIFAAPAEILQPPGCPPTGGGNLADLSPAAVLEAVRRVDRGQQVRK